MAKVTGGTRFETLLLDIDDGTTRRVGVALFAAAEEIKVAAQISLTTGAQSGKNHQPSAPGTPPNQDSGVLGGNIEALLVEPLKAIVTSEAPYAAIQEYGGTINHPNGATITLPERPYMRPALAQKRQRVRELIKGAIRASIKGRATSGD